MKKTEQIEVVTTFEITYPDTPGARELAIQYVTSRLPIEGCSTSFLGTVNAKRGASKLVESQLVESQKYWETPPVKS